MVCIGTGPLSVHHYPTAPWVASHSPIHPSVGVWVASTVGLLWTAIGLFLGTCVSTPLEYMPVHTYEWHTPETREALKKFEVLLEMQWERESRGNVDLYEQKVGTC